MIRLLNPNTRKTYQVTVQHCLDHDVVVEVIRDGRIVKVPYDHLDYVSDDWIGGKNVRR